MSVSCLCDMSRVEDCMACERLCKQARVGGFNGTEVLFPKLVEVVEHIQGYSAAGEHLWKAWISRFAGESVGHEHPKNYSASFLMSFLVYVKDVQYDQKDVHAQDGDMNRLVCSSAQRVVASVEPGMRSAVAIPCYVQDKYGGIPKYVYVSAANRQKLSSWYEGNFRRLQDRIHGWCFVFLDDVAMQNIIKSECSVREQRAFFAINPKYGAARSDFFRYHLMRSRGGMWLDAKSGLRMNLDRSLSRYFPLPPLVLGLWDIANQHQHIPEDVWDRGEIQNWWLLSAVGHPVWDAVLAGVCANIENYSLGKDGVGKLAVLKLTGPIAMSRILYPLLPQWPHLLRKATEFFFEYDMMVVDGRGKHELLQCESGGVVHYSMLKEPLVLR